MHFRVWLINIVLLGMVVFFGIRAYGVWSQGMEIPGKDPGSGSSKRDVGPSKTIIKKEMPPASAYDVLVRKDLFSPRRQAPEEKAAEVEKNLPPIPAEAKKILLFGVILMEGYKTALVSNPDQKSAKDNDLWVKEGDHLGDFKVSLIEKEKIVLEKDKESFDVFLYDKGKPERRTVVQKPTEPKVVAAGPTEPAAKPKVSRPENPPDTEYEIIKTPFGDRKVKKQ